MDHWHARLRIEAGFLPDLPHSDPVAPREVSPTYTREYPTSYPGSNRCEVINTVVSVRTFIYCVGGAYYAATPFSKCDCKIRCYVKILLVHCWYCAEYFYCFLKKCSRWKNLGKNVTLFMNKEYSRLFMSSYFSRHFIQTFLHLSNTII